MVVQVPAGELARGNAAGHGVKPAEQALGAGPAPLEHRVVHHLVEQDGEVEHREALQDGQRNPDRRVIEADERPRADGQQGELPHRHGQVAKRGLRWSARSWCRYRPAEFGVERRVPAVVVWLRHATGLSGFGMPRNHYSILDVSTATPLSADITAFLGGRPAAARRLGAAAGLSFVIVGLESEYTDAHESIEDGAPRIRTGNLNLLLPTPMASAGSQRPPVLRRRQPQVLRERARGVAGESTTQKAWSRAGFWKHSTTPG